MASKTKNTSAAVSHRMAGILGFARVLVTSTNLEQPQRGLTGEPDHSRSADSRPRRAMADGAGNQNHRVRRFPTGLGEVSRKRPRSILASFAAVGGHVLSTEGEVVRKALLTGL